MSLLRRSEPRTALVTTAIALEVVLHIGALAGGLALMSVTARRTSAVVAVSAMCSSAIAEQPAGDR